ncbi:MAG: hypothetical protein U1F59_00880 [Candidatus Competibacteraceae bacterium]
MTTQTINSATVEIILIAADGKTVPEGVLDDRETATVETVDQALRTTESFQTAYPQAVLERVESMRGVDEKRNGRYYLRYRYAGGVTEFWGHIGRELKIDFKKGVVGVVLPAPH